MLNIDKWFRFQIEPIRSLEWMQSLELKPKYCNWSSHWTKYTKYVKNYLTASYSLAFKKGPTVQQLLPKSF